MRDGLERLLREATILTVALGIALGWALYQVAEGVSHLVAALLTDVEFAGNPIGTALTWGIGDRVLSLGPLVYGLIELAVVLLVAALVLRRTARRP